MSKQPLEENGIHRAKTWEIALYALNNTSTNAYMFLVGSISYFLVGIVGIGAVLAGSIVTIMRIWDGVTDPFVGMLVDNTNTRFGKNRPFIVAGQVILFTMTFVMFRLIPSLPTGARFIAFIVIYAIYIVGYTCQCVVTKSAQTCLTNDPRQRPVFSMFDSVYGVLYNTVFWPVFLSSTLVPKFTLNSAANAAELDALIAKNPNLANVLTEKEGVKVLSGFYNPAMWQYAQLIVGAISAVFAVLAIVGLSRKDNAKYYGLGKVERIGFKDYADVLAHNRGIQMLVMAASSDKLALNCLGNSAVTVSLFGIIFGNYALSGSVSALAGIPVALFGMLGMNYIARRLGQKKCLVVGTWGSLITAAGLACLIIFGRSAGMRLPVFKLTNPATWGSLFSGANWSIVGVLFLLLYIGMKGFSQMSGSIVIPMTADCADYEVYRSGRYVPGLMGTLFSFVDKLISSLASTIVALVYAAVGFTTTLPTEETPFSTGILVATLVCYLGMPVIGWILNVVAMKFYPLTREKMAEIQDEIARIKAEASRV
ncbi:MFS transporter [Gemmiger sp.]|uniref:MFS transporter n=1 Tax=Gemmiger sp. TaxID=2049027 RepID=UPI003F06A08B